MKPTRIALIVLVAFAVLVAAACGSSKESVPPDAVAVVDGTPVTKAELDGLLERAKITYKAQKRAFPKAGTAEYQDLQTQGVAYLVQRAEYANKAAEMKITVTDKDVTDRINQVKQQSYAGSQVKLEKDLKAQGYTDETLRSDIKAQLLSEKIYVAVTNVATVSDADVAKYYQAHKADYAVADSRAVRHILVSTKAQADKIYNQLKAGASFATLAKKYSIDQTSAVNGGALTVERGKTVAPFDAIAFSEAKNVVSRPVKTQYGYHVIEATGDIKPAHTESLKDAKVKIQAQLLDTAKKAALTKWVADTKAFFAKRVAYATGYAPPAQATTPATTTG